MALFSSGRSVALLLCALAAGCARVDRIPSDASEPAPSHAHDGGSGDAALEPATGDGLILFSPMDDHPDVFGVSAAFRSNVPPRDLPPLADDHCRSFDTDSEAYVGDATAGKITVRAGSRQVSLKLVGEGDPDRMYTVSSPLEGLLPGVPIEVEATGDTVPAFRVSVEVPHPLELLTPLTDGIAKDAAFEVAWQPTPRDQLLSIVLVGKNRYVSCVTDTTRRAFVVPEEHVRALAADPSSTADGKPALGLRLSTLLMSTVRAGAFDVSAQSSRRLEATLVLH